MDVLRRSILARAAGALRFVSDFTDADLVFLMPVFRDAEVAGKSLRRLRRVYPGSRVVILSDGDPEFPGDTLATEFRAEYVLGENLYGSEHGGRMLQRYLDLYLAAPARWMVRMDTDARIDRRFSRLPTADALYGTIGRRSGTVQGGCILLTDGAVRRLSDARVFLRPELADPAASWGRFSTPDNLRRKLSQGRIAYDKMLHWGCVEAGLPIRDFREIRSVWKSDDRFRRQVLAREGVHAIVHPDRMETE